MDLDNHEYRNWITELKKRIAQSQIRASLKVNEELLKLYWSMGKDIVEKQIDSKWGSGFFEKLSNDLKISFPDMDGFSSRNLRYCKKFYQFYSQENLILQQAAAKSDSIIFQIPWFHQVHIITKCKTIDEALFYVEHTLKYGWSRSVLEHQLSLSLYNREGQSITNFNKMLPKPQSDLAEQVLKDPYIFDFLTIRKEYDEKELQRCLVGNMTKFLLELGSGFSFYGQQVHLNVGNDDFYIDLLFYHVKLHCYIVVELKTTKFKPEHIGQLKFYVTAVNRQLRSEYDGPTIGLLICKDKNDIVAEYTISDIDSPIGISSYDIYDKISEGYMASLPTIEDIERRLKD